MLDKRICDVGYVLILDEEFYQDGDSANRFVKSVEGKIGEVVLLVNDRIFNGHKAKASALR
ncbi:MAG: hypothetical protein JRN68_06900 [Nitrososphaerota archaeon]|nr:hypothetical protein [Nitrososphaerota archaeon]